MKKIKALLDSIKEKHKKDFIKSVQQDANRRYNIVFIKDKCFLTLDEERISSNYSNFNEACKELSSLRNKYLVKTTNEALH